MMEARLLTRYSQLKDIVNDVFPCHFKFTAIAVQNTATLIIAAICLAFLYLIMIGVSGSLVITFAAIRLQGPSFKSRPRKKFLTRFLLHALPWSVSGTTTSGTRASPKPGNSPKK